MSIVKLVIKILLAAFIFVMAYLVFSPTGTEIINSRLPFSIAKTTPTPIPFLDNKFDIEGSLEEATNSQESGSPYWWLNSGALFTANGGYGQTIQGKLLENSYWRKTYSKSSPINTDDGYHPQNIFRLVTRGQWQNFSQQVYFRIIKDNLSASSHRNASNGLLLFNRYLDGDNLYYTGIRVDGDVVIKKKLDKVYYTMAIGDYFSETEYHRDSNPNLLPKNVWIGVKSEVTTNPEGVVNIKLFIDLGKTGKWDLVLEAKDAGQQYGSAPIFDKGFAGIRTDFMDVEFDNYEIFEI